MPYTISGTTINVSGTVDLMKVSLPPIFRINFAAGGATATFNTWAFVAIPPQGIDNYTVVGNASRDVLTISMVDHGPQAPSGPTVTYPSEPSIDLSFFSFANWGANDVIVLNGNSDANDIFGTYRKEIINGGGSNDFLHSGTGAGSGFADTLRGGEGNDTYDIHPSDIVDETGSGGVDTIRSYWSYSLPSANVRGVVENLVLTANNVDTYAIGNARPNKLVGGAANNVLNGLSGNDVMQGRAGNDTYFVDTVNDTVDESLGGSSGLDTVRSYVSYALSDTVHVKGAVENLALLGVAIKAQGNGLNNAITGNGFANFIEGLAGNDALNGAGGADELQGGTGNDTYVLGSEASGVDKVVDSSGADTITSSINRSLIFADYSEIENLALVGNAVSGVGNGLANVMVGNARANTLNGFTGNDRLGGAAGNDVLVGGLGADIFVFNTALNSASNRDTVADFVHGQDKFWLDNAVMAKLGAGVHALSPLFFHAGPAAADANDYIVYNRASGVLAYDADGNGAGAAVGFAMLSNHPVLTAADFLVT
jgi:Ca2+-binding RTX toxin-like protein